MNATALVAFCCLLQCLINTPLDFSLTAHRNLLLTPSELKTAPTTSRDICFCCFPYFFLLLILNMSKSKSIFPCCYFSLILFNVISLLWQKTNRKTPVWDPTQMEIGLLTRLPKLVTELQKDRARDHSNTTTETRAENSYCILFQLISQILVKF